MVSSMSEKSLKPSRYLLFLVTVSISLLVLSFIILLQSNTTSSITRSVFKQLLVNNSSVYFKPNTNVDTNDYRNHSPPFESPPMNSGKIPEMTIQGSNTKTDNTDNTNDNLPLPPPIESNYVTKTRTQSLNTNTDNNHNRNHNPPFVESTTSISKVPETNSQDSKASNVVGELGQERRNACDANQALLRVYMYDLPPEFHFGLLGWIGEGNQVWPDVSNVKSIPHYPGGLNLQHSPEYWLTLDLIASNTPSVKRPCSAVRVQNASQADMIFVPFFSSLSYNRQPKVHGRGKKTMNRLLQEKLVEFLMSRKEWKKRRGKDHIILAHHPNSMLDVRKKLGSAMFVLADFGRYPHAIANIKKDIIAPYKHIVHTINGDSAGFDRRPILLYFQGAIYRKDGGFIRQELYYLLKDEKDVHFTFGSVRGSGVHRASEGMASSKFCLNIAGDTPSSNRLFDAIASHCVPVIISDEIELPFEDVLDYSEFCIFVRASDAVKKGFLLRLLQGITPDEWTKMSEKLKIVSKHFEYQYPSQSEDAVDMIWQAVSHKRSSKFSLQFKLHKENRFRRPQLIRGINRSTSSH